MHTEQQSHRGLHPLLPRPASDFLWCPTAGCSAHQMSACLCCCAACTFVRSTLGRAATLATVSSLRQPAERSASALPSPALALPPCPNSCRPVPPHLTQDCHPCDGLLSAVAQRSATPGGSHVSDIQGPQRRAGALHCTVCCLALSQLATRLAGAWQGAGAVLVPLNCCAASAAAQGGPVEAALFAATASL